MRSFAAWLLKASSACRIAAFGSRGLKLQYESAETLRGLLLVGGTAKGVSFVGFGESEDALLHEMKHDYPDATLRPAATSPGAGRWLQAVAEALEEPTKGAEIPLDVVATAFQARVWRTLREIPLGETRTDSGLAAALNQPTATRAVARACATKRVSILIPCHRVVGVGGDLTGYRWGKQRKAALLEQERLAAMRIDEAR